jgi:hypothetical protein
VRHMVLNKAGGVCLAGGVFDEEVSLLLALFQPWVCPGSVCR